MADNSGGSIGFFGFLTILFIGLKLGGVISWSWWWVFAPLWGPLCLALFIILCIFLYAYKAEM